MNRKLTGHDERGSGRAIIYDGVSALASRYVSDYKLVGGRASGVLGFLRVGIRGSGLGRDRK